MLKDYIMLSSLILKSHFYVLENLHFFLPQFIYSGFPFPALFSFFQVSFQVYNPSSKQDWMMVATQGVRLTGQGNKN